MREQLEHRLQQLKIEFEGGRKMLAELEVRQANLKEALLRISGAIQVLEELKAEAQPSDSDTEPADGVGERMIAS